MAGEAAERAVLVDGLMPAAEAGTILLNCGTNSVSFSRELHQHAERRNLRFLDTPVSGARVHRECSAVHTEYGAVQCTQSTVRRVRSESTVQCTESRVQCSAQKVQCGEYSAVHGE